ncbi:phosphoglycerate mutase [Amylostereum chailletii]|nr:phosphoglycerate mutase [Amylostereum chailletii]
MPTNYQIVPGFFAHEQPGSTVQLDPTPPYFGLVSQSWASFTDEIDRLNSVVLDGTSVKVFFLGRHGQGYHNVAASKYGEEAWDAHWSKLTGDGEIVWGPDPYLTSLGETQARDANKAWKREKANGIPLPETFYCSPMRRALHTYQLTWEDIVPPSAGNPMILENCREVYGEHTCDQRRTRSKIHADFPLHRFEEGFAEEDMLYTTERESEAHAEVRARSVLDTIFAEDQGVTYVSITAHGGIINAFLRVIGRGDYHLTTGGVMAVVVRQSRTNHDEL